MDSLGKTTKIQSGQLICYALYKSMYYCYTSLLGSLVHNKGK